MVSLRKRLSWWQVYTLLSFLCMIMITVQFRAFQGSFILKFWDSRIVSYLGAAAVSSLRGDEGFPSFFRSHSDLIRENAALKRELDQSRLQLHQTLQRLAKAEQLAPLHDFLQPFRPGGHYVQVTGQSMSWYDQVVILSCGSEDGFHVNDTVIGVGGLAGRLVHCSPHYSELQTVTNVGFAAAVRFRDSSAQGIIKGTGKHFLTCDYVHAAEIVQPGDIVFTSGKEGLYPPNYPIGSVSAVSKGPLGFLNITVVPFVDLPHLQCVFVISRR